MKELYASNFFNLSKFKHAEIFDKQGFVWHVLEKIEGYLRSLKLGEIEGEVHPGAFLVDPHLISIGKGTIVEPGAYIKGPCFIGKDSTVRHGAYIRGNLIAGDKCVIGHDTEVKNAIFLDEAHAAHFAYVGDSVLGNRVNLGAGTKCANLKFDKSQITVHYKGTRIETGLRKFGAIFGDDVQIGCNVVANPGTLFGKGVYCWPTINVSGVIPEQTNVKGSERQLIESRKR